VRDGSFGRGFGVKLKGGFVMGKLIRSFRKGKLKRSFEGESLR
jgi:hypothetical protein